MRCETESISPAPDLFSDTPKWSGRSWILRPPPLADEINNASDDLVRLRVHFACADAFSRALARNMTLREFLSRDAQEQMISLTQLPLKSRRVKLLQRS
jgi:hypothetical protein